MLTIFYAGKEYIPGDLIPLNLGNHYLIKAQLSPGLPHIFIDFLHQDIYQPTTHIFRLLIHFLTDLFLFFFLFLGLVTDHAYYSMDLKFHCKSGCHSNKPLKLGFTCFTRNIPHNTSEEQFGIHQDKASAVFAVEIKWLLWHYSIIYRELLY